MRTMCDFLVWYNNCDVKTFFKAIEAQVEIYESKKIDMFKANVSLYGVAQRRLMVTSDKSKHALGKGVWVDFIQGAHTCMLREYLEESIPSRTYTSLIRCCMSNMVGGPSIVFHRYHEVGVTRFREDLYGSAAKNFGLVQGYDANALHAYCAAQPQPVHQPVCSKYKDGVLNDSTTQWLECQSAFVVKVCQIQSWCRCSTHPQ